MPEIIGSKGQIQPVFGPGLRREFLNASIEDYGTDRGDSARSDARADVGGYFSHAAEPRQVERDLLRGVRWRGGFRA